jgi:hypothetical protein
MKKYINQKKKKYIIIILICSTQLFAQYKLPIKYSNYLNINYPNWKYSNKAKYCEAGGIGTSKSIIKFDFNKDEQPDYVVKINSRNHGYIIVFFSLMNSFKTNVIEDIDGNMDDCKINLYKGKLYVNFCEVSSYFCKYNGSTLEKHWLTD